jgi:hypothetical protein
MYALPLSACLCIENDFCPARIGGLAVVFDDFDF